MDGVWMVDVGVCRHFPLHPCGEFWIRFALVAPDATEAELTACLWAGNHGRPAWSVVVDWP